MASHFSMVRTFLSVERKKDPDQKADAVAPPCIKIMMGDNKPEVQIKNGRGTTWNGLRDEVTRIEKLPEFSGATCEKILEHLVKWALEKQPSGTQAKSNRKRGVDDVVVAPPTPLVSLSGGSGQPIMNTHTGPSHELSGGLALADVKRMIEAAAAMAAQQVMNQQRSPNRLALQDSSMEDVKQLAATQMIEMKRAEVLAEAAKQFRGDDGNRDEILTKAGEQMREGDKEEVLAAAAQQFRGDDGNHDEILAKAAEQMRDDEIMTKAVGQMIENDKEKVLAEAAKQLFEDGDDYGEILEEAGKQMNNNDYYDEKVLERAARQLRHLYTADTNNHLWLIEIAVRQMVAEQRLFVLGKAAEHFRAERVNHDEIMAKAVEQMLKEDRAEVLQKAAENIKLGLGDQDRFIEKMDEDSDGTDEEENVISLANAVKARRKRRRHS